MPLAELKSQRIWMVVGSQHLYGPRTLAEVDRQSREVAAALAASDAIPVGVDYKGVVTTPAEILELCKAANSAADCIGLVFWMHTFSPAKMWIAGLQALQKPFLHLNTQYGESIPWPSIDMDYMNLNQSAHGDREFGYICSRLGIERTIVCGHWRDLSVQRSIGRWARAAAGREALRTARICRFGDNMRQVAVTEGDKVEAQMRLGATIDGYGLGDLAAFVDAVAERRIREETDRVLEACDVDPELRPGESRHGSLTDALQIELGLRDFLDEHGYHGFTTTFEILHGLKQLPGISAQRMMADGYGFGAEGDWKTAILVRAMKTMAQGLPGGTSFMEDYTYDFREQGGVVLGSHMLEICPSIASQKPRAAVHPLAIGGKEDPVRLIFTAPPGPAINVAMIDLGDRFRLVLNELDVVEAPHELPKLPVAAAFWRNRPSFETGTACWLQAGGAHHSCFSMALETGHMRDLAEMVGIELAVIDGDTTVHGFKQELRLAAASRR